MQKLLTLFFALVFMFGVGITTVAPVEAHVTNTTHEWKSQVRDDYLYSTCYQGRIRYVFDRYEHYYWWHGIYQYWHWDHKHFLYRYSTGTAHTC